MTNDTRIAMEKIAPIAYELNIEVSADDKFLYCNGQAIGISCNSTYATINEFLGYAFLNMCRREYRFKDCGEDKTVTEAVKRYWISNAMLKKLNSNIG